MRLLHKHDEKLDNLEKLTKKLETNPAFKMMLEQEATENLEKRKAAGAKLESLRQKEETLAGDDALHVVVDKLADLEKQRQELLKELQIQRGATMKQKAGLEAQIRHEEGVLFSTYDQKIDETIQFFRDKLDELRKPGRICTERGGILERNILSEKITSQVESNRQAVNDAMRYCQDAIQALEASKLLPEIDLKKIETMKKDIPAIDVYSSIETERKAPGWRVPAAMDLIPSNAAMDYTRDSLLEKADKILQRRAA